MQSGDNAGTSPISEWPTGTWSTPEAPSSHSAPLASARVPISRSVEQVRVLDKLGELATEEWPAAEIGERDDPLQEVLESDERITSLSGESLSAISGVVRSPGEIDASQVANAVATNPLPTLGEKDSGIALVAAGLSHDLNNLLVGVMSNAEFAQAAFLRGEDPSSFLAAIRLAADRASALATSMVRFASEQRAAVTPFDLSELVGEIVMLARAGVSKSAQVVRAGDAASDDGAGPPTWVGDDVRASSVAADGDDQRTPLMVTGDAGQIGQVVLNLIVNGADALNAGGGEVHIDVERVSEPPRQMFLRPSRRSVEGFARLRVADTGAGIPAELLPRIFEPFFSTKNRGRGLGLSNCLEIIRSHDGGLNVSSQVGRGTTFEVYLPLSAVPRARAIRAPEPHENSEWRTSGRVLVIDDEPMVARLTAMVLEHVGLKPTIEHSGRAGMERLRQSLTDPSHRYRVCVVDLTMPDISGQDLLLQIKSCVPELPVVLTSGFSEQQIRTRGAFEGFDGFLQKPFRMSTMVDVLKRTLEPQSD